MLKSYSNGNLCVLCLAHLTMEAVCLVKKNRQSKIVELIQNIKKSVLFRRKI